MTTFTFNKQAVEGEPTGLVIYSDSGCTLPAPVTINGLPLADSKVDRNPDGSWPSFQCTSAPVFYLDGNGAPQSLSPEMSFASPVPVTGSRGTATASVLESLIQSLISVGVPIIDNTTP